MLSYKRIEKHYLSKIYNFKGARFNHKNMFSFFNFLKKLNFSPLNILKAKDD